jgi:hypothetical protein
MLVFAIVVKWKLRRHVWFWITMATILAIHGLLILSVAWTTKWIPAIVIIPIAVADLYAILAIVSVVEKSMERPEKL